MTERKPHITMTPKEYREMPIVGWHEVCRNVDCWEGVGVRYLGETKVQPDQPPIHAVITHRGYDAARLGLLKWIDEGYERGPLQFSQCKSDVLDGLTIHGYTKIQNEHLEFMPLEKRMRELNFCTVHLTEKGKKALREWKME